MPNFKVSNNNKVSGTIKNAIRSTQQKIKESTKNLKESTKNMLGSKNKKN
jgi:hypothetical protein